MIAGIAISALVISINCLVISIFAFIELRSFNKSTHKVQYIPVDETKGDNAQQFLKNMYSEDEVQV